LARPRAAIVVLTLENDISPYDCPRGRAAASAPPDWNYDPDDGSLSLTAIKLRFTDHSALYNLIAIAAKPVDVLDHALMALGVVARPHAMQDAVAGSTAIERTADELAWLGQNMPAGIPFAVLFVPSRHEVRDHAPAHIAMRKALVASLDQRGVAVIDPTASFQAVGFVATHFPHDGHWTPLGHEVAGKAAAGWLASAFKTTAAP
jgi:hypothetical protein